MRAIVIALVIATTRAHAGGVITRHGSVIAATPERVDTIDPSTSLLRALSGLAWANVTGALGGDRDSVRGEASVDVLAIDYPVGSLAVGTLGASYFGAARYGAELARIDELFWCHDESGEAHIPIWGHSHYRCDLPRLGIGGALAEVAWEPTTRRVTARWGEVRAVANLVGAPDSTSYLLGHVDVQLGVAAESVWHGNRDARAGSDHVARGDLDVRALMRSKDARWELAATAAVRPAIGSERDLGATSELALRCHELVGEATAITLGLAARGEYWSDPAMALAPLSASTRAWWLGVTMEWRHESAR